MTAVRKTAMKTVKTKDKPRTLTIAITGNDIDLHLSKGVTGVDMVHAMSMFYKVLSEKAIENGQKGLPGDPLLAYGFKALVEATREADKKDGGCGCDHCENKSGDSLK